MFAIENHLDVIKKELGGVGTYFSWWGVLGALDPLQNQIKWASWSTPVVPALQEMEVGGPEVQGYSWLHMEFEVSMGYIEKQKQNKKTKTVYSLEEIQPHCGI